MKLNQTTPSETFYQQRLALLVGVDRYEDSAISDLKVCAGDVQAVHDLLTANGYEFVQLLTAPVESTDQVVRADVLAKLTSIARSADEDDLLLFYFSGHGVESDGQAYLLPTDARYTAITDTAVNIGRVKEIIQESAARAKVIILDACHSGAHIGEAPPEMTETFIRHVFEEAEGIAILASCKQQEISWEWFDKGRSAFTYYLLEALQGEADFDEKGFVTIGDINRYVTHQVKTWAMERDRHQTPTLQTSAVGDIVLAAYVSAPVLKSPDSSLTIDNEANTSGTVSVDNAKKTSRKQPADKSPPNGTGTRSAITWLHLSDLHFRPSQAYDGNIVLQSLLDDATNLIRKDSLQPDFVVVTGDIAFSGKPAEYELARVFLDDLLNKVNLPRERLFIVPGNHDVDRNAVSELAASASTIFGNRNTVFRSLEDTGDRDLLLKRLHNYQDFVNDYLGKDHIPFDSKRYFYTKWIRIAGLHVAILGLNSAWLSVSDQDRNNLILGERQVRAALDMAKDADLCLALMHHPFDWLQDFDRSDVEPLLRDRCAFVLHGHMHQVGLLQAKTPGGEAMVIAAGACYKTRDHPNSYNFVQFEPSTGKGTVYLRMYSDRGGGFWTRDVLNYHNVDNGVYTFSLPTRSPIRRSPPSPASKPSHPFVFGRPVQPDEFVDREGDLRIMLSRIHNGESTAIVGEPHIGKTSLLLKLEDELAKQRDLGDSSHRLVASFLDLHSIGSDYSTISFWNKAFEPIRQSCSRKSIMQELDQVAHAGYVRESLESFFERLEQERLRVVLLLDEFERLLSHPNFQDFSFYTSYHTPSPSVCFVIASRYTLRELNNLSSRLPYSGGSPPFNAFIEERLPLFDRQATDTLLSRAGDALSHQDRRLVHRVAGGHPFLIQTLAAALMETTTGNRHMLACERFYRWASPHFGELWDRLEDYSRVIAMLLSLVTLQGHSLEQCFDPTKVQQPNAFSSELEKLRKLRLAKPIGEDWSFGKRRLPCWQGEQWTIESPAFAWWIRERIISEAPTLPHSKWTASQFYHSLLAEQLDWLNSAMRNVAEQSLRKLIQTTIDELTEVKEE